MISERLLPWLAFAFGAGAMWLWHAHNTLLPIGDSATYLFDAQEIYHSFEDGVLSGLHAAYWHRGTRPIIFPALAVPFLAIARGNLLLAVGLTQSCSAGLLGLFLYELVRHCADRTIAICAVPIVLSLPAMNYIYQDFFSESALMPALAAAASFGISIGCQGVNRENGAGFVVSVALALLIRPVETGMALVGPLVILLLVSKPAVYVNVRFFACLLAIAAIVAVWWAPFVREFYDWAFASSFGSLVKETESMQSASISDVIRFSLSPVDTLAIEFVAGIAAVAVALALLTRRFAPHALELLVMGAISLAVSGFVAGSAGAFDARRLFGAAILLAAGVVGAVGSYRSEPSGA